MQKKQITPFVFASFALFAGSTLASAGAITGKVAAAKGPSVVYVEGIDGKTLPAAAKPTTIDQEGLMFQPHVAVVQAGTTVNFLNRDRVAHNIFWPSVSGNKKLGHNLGTWPTGETRPFTFNTPGVVPLLCNVHPEMSAYLVVVPTPYYAMTDDSGNYTLSDVPSGQYRVSAWHEGMKVQTKPVTVASTVPLDFALSK